jgi:hypothetical protein
MQTFMWVKSFWKSLASVDRIGKENWFNPFIMFCANVIRHVKHFTTNTRARAYTHTNAAQAYITREWYTYDM